MLSAISEFQRKIWDKWNVRIVILFSLFLQIFLIVSAPSRKRTRRRFFVSFVWLAYLLADWAAGYCIGLISNNQEQKSSLSKNDYLMAFWGPFLLLHLGGPDTISAFALEDNELWLRHLFALIFQSLTTGYVFLLTVPHNTTLWLPTILMFVAGLIKYAERIHALYVAAVNNFKKSLLPRPDAGPEYAKIMEVYSSKLEARLPAEMFVIPELRQRSANDAEQKNGGMVMITKRIFFVLFIKEERHGNDFNKLDVRVTYALMFGALFLDVMALVMRVFTDYTATLSDKSLIEYGQASFYQKFRISVFKCLNERFLACFLRLSKPTWSKIDKGAYKGCEKLSTNFIFRRWSGSIPGRRRFKIVVSILDFFYQRDKHSRFKDFLDQLRYQSTNPFIIELWKYIFDKLREKSDETQDIKAIQSVCSARGERVIQKVLQNLKLNKENFEEQLKRLKPFVDPKEVTFDESLLLWHIATTLCYAKDVTIEGHEEKSTSYRMKAYGTRSFQMKEGSRAKLIVGK
ncbi:hypothetical protein K1719_046066 [Acacia pycnantha]|nr:hypothetical protein K1719_046066 [Acacia pycnantha]